MLKTGQLTLVTESGKRPFHFYWYSDGPKERLDIIENINNYSPVDSSSCDASYINLGSEKIYGSDYLIKTFFKIRHSVMIAHVKEEQTTRVEDGKFIIEKVKSDNGIGIYYKAKLVNGLLDNEIFATNDGMINIYDIQPSTALFKPFNVDAYTVFTKITNHATSINNKNKSKFKSYEELLRMYPEVHHVIEPPNDYVVVQSYEEAVERLKIWKESKEQLKSYDIESLDKLWGNFSNNKITGVFLGYGETWSTYFPFRQENFDYNLPIEFLKEIFDAINSQPPAPEVILLAHNAKFELEGFYQEYREMPRIDVDTYLLAILVNPNIGKGTHTLKALTAKVDGKFYLTLEQIFNGPVEFNILPPNIVKLYGCPDATSPAKIYKYLMEKLPKDEHYVLSLEMELLPVKVLNEFYGLPIDQERLQRLIDEEEYKIKVLGDLFRSIHKTSKNINSGQVLQDIIYNKLRCPVEVKTNKGLPSTSHIAIEHIVNKGTLRDYDKTKMPADILDLNDKPILKGEELASNKYPSLVIYQRYKKSCKEIGALRRLRDHSLKDRFMFYINQSGAGSNRQTSDAHQFSDTMKSCVVADSKHHQLVSCDWSQVELRVLAWLAGQEDLIKLESDPSVDIHRAILSIIQGKPMWDISEEERKKGKSVNFGVVYMMTEYGLATRDFGPAYTKEELNEEKQKITDFFNGLPKIKVFMKQNEEFLKNNGYIKTKFNYYRPFPQLLDPTLDNKIKRSLIRSGNNTPVQGTAAQMLKMVECRVLKYIKDKGWDKECDYDGVMLPMARMMLPIHDEILFSYDKERIPIEEIITMFKECMELDFKGAPPFFAAPAFINNWYDGKDDAWAVDIPFRDKVVEEYKKGHLILSGKPYLETLNEFRNSELENWMKGLIAQYKDLDSIIEHAHHDSLTNTLISTMLSKKERKGLTHRERIAEATRRYVNKLINDNLQEVTITLEEDTDITEFIDTNEWFNEYSRIDENGDLISEVIDEEDTSDTDVILYDEETSMMEDFKIPRVLYTLDQCIIDFNEVDIDNEAEIINREIQELQNPKEWYKVIYLIKNKSYDTKMRIGYCPNEINAIFDKHCKVQYTKEFTLNE